MKLCIPLFLFSLLVVLPGCAVYHHGTVIHEHWDDEHHSTANHQNQHEIWMWNARSHQHCGEGYAMHGYHFATPCCELTCCPQKVRKVATPLIYY